MNITWGWFATFLHHHHVLVWAVLLWFQNNQLFCPFVPRSLILTWHCTWIFFFIRRHTFFWLPIPPNLFVPAVFSKNIDLFHRKPPLEWTITMLYCYFLTSSRIFLGVLSVFYLICCMLRFSELDLWKKKSKYLRFWSFALAFLCFSLGLVVCVHPLVVILLASCSAISFTVMGDPLNKKLLSSRCDSSLGHSAEN